MYIDFVIRGCISVGIPVGINIMLFYRSVEFVAVKNIGYRIKKGIVKKINQLRRS